MRARWKVACLASVAFCLIAFLAVYFVLKSHIHSADFRSFAEKRVGEFLKADVRIGDVRPDFINQIALSKIQVESGEASKPFSLQIDKIVFEYNVLNLFTRNLNHPNTIVLQTPQINLSRSQNPQSLFQKLNLESRLSASARLKIQGGQVRLPLGPLHSELLLANLHGFVTPASNGTFQLDFHSDAKGIMEGKMHISGTVDPLHQRQDLRVDLQSVKLDRKAGVPLNALQGQVRWVNDKILLENISGSLHGWAAKISGEVNRVGSKPVLDIKLSLGKNNSLVNAGLNMDFGTGDMEFIFKPLLKQVFSLNGHVRRDGMNFRFEDLETSRGYTGRGRLNFDEGIYRFDFEKQKKKIRVSSHFREFDFDLNVDLGHVDFYGMDLVCSAKIRLEAVDSKWSDQDWKFRGTFDTDYFILEFAPFEDLKGSFEVVPYDIQKIEAGWGDSFEVSGAISYDQQRPDADLEVRVKDFDLGKAREFGAKTLPSNLAGIMDGKLILEGPLERPEVQGDFRIRDGRLGRLDYDSSVLRFRGFPPYLALYDSRVYRGRMTLGLTGALDLSLSNIFHGVAVETPDKFLLWKGWELHTNQQEGEIAFNHNAKGIAAITFQSGETSAHPLIDETKKDQESQFVGVGPKLKF